MNSLALLLLLAADPMAAPPPAAPVQVTVFGIALREPLAMPECKVETPRAARPLWGKRDAPTTRPSRYAFDLPTEPCYERRTEKIGSGDALHDETLRLQYPYAQRPTLSNNVAVYVLNGRVERIWFFTAGIRTQERDLEALTEKFGAPQVLDRSEVKTMAGSSFPAVTAVWSLPNDVSVTFFGADGSIDKGQAIIATPEGQAGHLARLKAITGGGTEL